MLLRLVHRPGALGGEGGLAEVAGVVEGVWEVLGLHVVPRVVPAGVGEAGAEGAVEALVQGVAPDVPEELCWILGRRQDT